MHAPLTLCMLGNFSCFCCRLLTFIQNLLSQKIISGTLSESQKVRIYIRTERKLFYEYHKSVKQFGSRSGPSEYLDPTCLQRLYADDSSLARKEIRTNRKLFHEFHQSFKQFRSTSGPTFCQDDLDPNCLQTVCKGYKQMACH